MLLPLDFPFDFTFRRLILLCLPGAGLLPLGIVIPGRLFLLLCILGLGLNGALALRREIVALAASTWPPIVTAWLSPILHICLCLLHLHPFLSGPLMYSLQAVGFIWAYFAPVTICVILSCSSLSFTSMRNSESMT